MGRRSLAVALVVGGSFVCNVARAEPVAPDVTADALVTTHLEGAVDARLEEHLDGDAWQTVCRAPCDVPLRVDATYRVNGPRIKASAPFVIAARERATIEVRPASSTRVVLGVVCQMAPLAHSLQVPRVAVFRCVVQVRHREHDARACCRVRLSVLRAAVRVSRRALAAMTGASSRSAPCRCTRRTPRGSTSRPR